MRRSLVILWLLLGMVPSIYGATSTLTGTLKDAQGNPINGRLTMQLPVPAVDTATNTNVPATLVSFSILNGAIQSGPSLYDVAGLSPANLYYITKVYDSANNLIETGYFVVTGATFNLGAAVPTTVTTSNISYVAPAQAGTCPTNQWIQALSATGPPSCSQPSAGQLSNGTTGSNKIVLSTGPTFDSPPILSFSGTPGTGFSAIADNNNEQTGAAASLPATVLATPNSVQRFALWFEVKQTVATVGCTTQPTILLSASWTEIIPIPPSPPGAITINTTVPLASIGGATYSTTAQNFATGLSAATIWVSMPLIFTDQTSDAVSYSTTYGAGVACTTGATYIVSPHLLLLP